MGDHLEFVPVLVHLKSGGEPIECRGDLEAYASFRLAVATGDFAAIAEETPEVAALLQAGLIPFDGALVEADQIAAVSLDPAEDDEGGDDDEEDEAPAAPINGGGGRIAQLFPDRATT